MASFEVGINGGYKAAEKDLSNLIELLMTQLIKLDGIAADGDVKMQRRVQVYVYRYIYIDQFLFHIFSLINIWSLHLLN